MNKELNDLKDDLNKAVRHDNSWDTIASQSELYKEKASTADGNLNSAIDYLDAEISSLTSQKVLQKQIEIKLIVIIRIRKTKSEGLG